MINERFSVLVVGKNKKKEGRSEFIGRWVLIHTSSGCTYRGKLVSSNEDIVRLDNAKRIDIPNSLELDHLFISKMI